MKKEGLFVHVFCCCSSSLNAAVRKASIVALGVFGSLTGVESQTHVSVGSSFERTGFLVSFLGIFCVLFSLFLVSFLILFFFSFSRWVWRY
jgi:hypothetical protein